MAAKVARSGDHAGSLGVMTRTIVLGEHEQHADFAAWLDKRHRLGQDLFDEVWEGEYHVAPAPHRRHGHIDSQVAVILESRARASQLWSSGPANIGSGPDDYRVPDRAYFRDLDPKAFEPTAAIVVEILSPGDESYAKRGFYFARKVEELLIVDPLERSVQWYARGAGLEPTERSTLLDMSGAELATAIDWPPSD
ncbi:hypothetical protein BH23ACT8_BH23ACT8_04140 [soil metagenome]|jgi:Uma2 family endonuclease